VLCASALQRAAARRSAARARTRAAVRRRSPLCRTAHSRLSTCNPQRSICSRAVQRQPVPQRQRAPERQPPFHTEPDNQNRFPQTATQERAVKWRKMVQLSEHIPARPQACCHDCPIQRLCAMTGCALGMSAHAAGRGVECCKRTGATVFVDVERVRRLRSHTLAGSRGQVLTLPPLPLYTTIPR
jgi:hypothetical protein